MRENGLLETERREGGHFDLGNLFHELCLDGSRNWFVYDKRRIGKDYESAKADNPGLIAIKTADERMLLDMYESVMANKQARTLIENCSSEQTFLWTDKETGIECKARADIYTPNGWIADIKTWTSRNGQCSPERFFWHVEDLGYHLSAAFYEMGREACIGRMKAPFYHIAVFKKQPYWCYCWPLSQYALEVAHRDVRRALNLLKECRDKQAEIESAGGNPADAWPDHLMETQHEGHTPSDSWLARNDYGYQ